MTKKVLFVFGFCLMLISCFTDGTKRITDNEGIYGEVYVKEIIYKNHSYLEFQDAGAGTYGQGWVHNPDCKCFQVYD